MADQKLFYIYDPKPGAKIHIRKEENDVRTFCGRAMIYGVFLDEQGSRELCQKCKKFYNEKMERA